MGGPQTDLQRHNPEKAVFLMYRHASIYDILRRDQAFRCVQSAEG
jgi:hypothetical protein